MNVLKPQLLAWLVHAFTASGAFVGLLALVEIHQSHLIEALWLIGIAIIIDSVDGLMARACRVKEVLPNVDGALLDNMVDYFNYTLVPCFFLLVSHMLPEALRVPCVLAIVMASSYQFTQVDAKTNDHFFKGFPSYWNIAVFYLFLWQLNATTNLIILLSLVVLSFVPIKYVYPTRLDYLSNNKYLRRLMGIGAVVWGAASLWLLWLYPAKNDVTVFISLLYILCYISVSLYRTKFPLLSRELVTNE